METSKLIVITNGNYFARLILDALFQHYAAHIGGVLIVTGDYKARTGLRAVWEIGKKTALPYLLYKIFTLVAFKIARHLFKKAIFDVETLSRHYGVPVHEVTAVNSEEALNWVAAQTPDLLVSVSCPQMIKRKMLSLAKHGGINIHSSLLPTYAGLAPYYWVLSNGERDTGTTVHYMTLKFDEGNILAQRSLEILPKESAFHLFKRLAELGGPAVVEAVGKALSENPGIKQNMAQYTYYSSPTFSSYIALKKQGHSLFRLGELVTAIRDEARKQGITVESVA